MKDDTKINAFITENIDGQMDFETQIKGTIQRFAEICEDVIKNKEASALIIQLQTQLLLRLSTMFDTIEELEALEISDEVLYNAAWTFKQSTINTANRQLLASFRVVDIKLLEYGNFNDARKSLINDSLTNSYVYIATNECKDAI